MTTISQNTIETIKQALLIKKQNLEKELSLFATKDPKVKGDWDSKYPRVPEGSIDDEAADEVEEYSTNLPIEHNLEIQLQNVAAALGKIQKNTYGSCEKCGMKIGEERLSAIPETAFCAHCAE